MERKSSKEKLTKEQQTKELNIRAKAEAHNQRIVDAAKILNMMEHEGFPIFMKWLEEQIDGVSSIQLVGSITKDNISEVYFKSVGAADSLNTIKSQFTVWKNNAKLQVLDNEEKVVKAIEQGQL